MRSPLVIEVPDVTEPAAAAAMADKWAPKLKALADRNRLHLALLLAVRPRTVKELESASGLSQALVSHHLKPLRDEGLVTVTPVGRSNRYALCCDKVVGVVSALSQLAVPPDVEAGS